MTDSKKIIILIIALAVPLFCLIVMVVGGLGFGAYSTFASNPEVDGAKVEDIFAMADELTENCEKVGIISEMAPMAGSIII